MDILTNRVNDRLAPGWYLHSELEVAEDGRAGIANEVHGDFMNNATQNITNRNRAHVRLALLERDEQSRVEKLRSLSGEAAG